MTDLHNKKSEFSKKMINATKKYQKKYSFDSGKNNSTHNNEADAFKHTYMQAYLTIYENKLFAGTAGYEHEVEGALRKQPAVEANMDLWNNQQGREIAEELKHEFGGSIKKIFTDDAISDIIADRVMKRLRSGALITSPDDKRSYLVKKLNLPLRNDNINLDDFERVFTTEEIGKMSNDEFSLYEPMINNQINNFKVPRKAEAEKAVINGELIWVNNYVRLDGTQVSGYFRHK